jgi:hypothetical protein
MKRISLVLLVVAALTAVFAGSASAAEQTAWQRLRTNVYTCDFTVTPANCVAPTDGSFIRWQTFSSNGQDSPLDGNARALVVHTISTDLTKYDYAEVFSRASLNLNKPASQVKNLSFDSYLPADQGGSPRIDVYFSNPLADGSTHVFIDALNCQQPIGGDWVRTDPTGRTRVGCTIFTDNRTTYASDGTHSAWANLVAANPDAQVAYTLMVFDEPSSITGINYRVDRISLGTNRMFTYSSTEAVSCNYREAAC